MNQLVNDSCHFPIVSRFRRYFCQMDLKPFYEVAEDAIKTLGVDPEATRCDQPGQWILGREEVEIFIDIWQPIEHNQWEYFKEDEPTAVFQVVSPVCYVPESEADRLRFLEEIPIHKSPHVLRQFYSKYRRSHGSYSV